MKTRLLAPLAFTLFCAPAWSQDEPLDFFTGTLEIHGDKPKLVRCDVVQNTYLLVDQDESSQAFLKQFQELGVSKELKYHATIIGSVRMENDKPILRVKSIENIRAGSCHLLDMF